MSSSCCRSASRLTAIRAFTRSPAIPTASMASRRSPARYLAPDTLDRAWRKGINPNDSLADNDGHGFFGALGDSVVTGPTLTNVNDFRAILIAEATSENPDMRQTSQREDRGDAGPGQRERGDDPLRCSSPGVDVFRLNFSHGTHEQHRERLQQIRNVEREVGRPIGVLADMQGPEASRRHVRGRPGHAGRGCGVSPRPHRQARRRDARASAASGNLRGAASPASNCLLDDGKLRLRVTRCARRVRRDRGDRRRHAVGAQGRQRARRRAAAVGADGEGPARPRIRAGSRRRMARALVRAASRGSRRGACARATGARGS